MVGFLDLKGSTNGMATDGLYATGIAGGFYRVIFFFHLKGHLKKHVATYNTLMFKISSEMFFLEIILKDGSDYFRIWGFYAKKPQNALGSLLVVINAWELVRLTIQIMKKLFKIYPTVIKHTENFLETLKIGNFFVFRDLSLILKEKRSVSYKLL